MLFIHVRMHDFIQQCLAEVFFSLKKIQLTFATYFITSCKILHSDVAVVIGYQCRGIITHCIKNTGWLREN